jgi:hypothetical protein
VVVTTSACPASPVTLTHLPSPRRSMRQHRATHTHTHTHARTHTHTHAAHVHSTWRSLQLVASSFLVASSTGNEVRGAQQAQSHGPRSHTHCSEFSVLQPTHPPGGVLRSIVWECAFAWEPHPPPEVSVGAASIRVSRLFSSSREKLKVARAV